MMIFFHAKRPLISLSWSGVLNTTGTKPEARSYHAATVYDKYMYIFGTDTRNHEDGTYDQNTYRLDLTTNGWSGALTTSGTKPIGRYGHKTVVYDKYMYVFGGTDEEANNLHDTHRLDLTNLTWSDELTTSGDKPGPVQYHSAIVYDKYMYVFGGYDDDVGYSQDTHRLDLTTLEWSGALTTTGTKPTGRLLQTAIVYNNYMYVFGGSDENADDCQDTHRLNLTTLAWSGELSTSGTKPVARSNHTAICYDKYMYIFGGTGNGNKQDTHRLDLTSNAWSGELTTSGVKPVARYSHTAVVYNKSMYIFGGFTTSNQQDTHKLEGLQ